ncbi:unnamed protein product [Thelazia callipaeda]|uniref:Methyl methanesulfonate-sensitivity protein 22-like n=1 Tax=Thelazia callipaeda TaxID=103827 RepID=A0A0N5D9I3_THECL|nr:unnamed protein product [Thelazia callipaeda]
MKETQSDIFDLKNELPDWLHVDWMCYNRCPERVTDDYSLPSVQYSLPSVLRLSNFSFNEYLLYTDNGIRTVFRRIRFLYQQIVSGTSDVAIIDLDRSLHYLTAFAQNTELKGGIETLNRIAREFKFFLIQVGTLSQYITHDDLFTKRNVETNYTFHALLIIWMKALRLSSCFKRFDGFEKFYPMGDESSSTEQISMLVKYGLLTCASRTGRPCVCDCLTAAWHQINSLNSEMFWSSMVKLLGLCTGDLNYYSPSNVSSGKASTHYAEYLLRISAKVPNKKYMLRKLYYLFENEDSDIFLGTECILQYFFTDLCAKIMECNQDLDFYPTSGKMWKDFLFSSSFAESEYQDNEWMLFIRLTLLFIKKSNSVWRAMKSRVFSKFPTKRFREMPINSLICIFSLFIASLHGADMKETSSKIILLATTAFDPCDKERHDVFIRAVQCIKYILDESLCDTSQVISTLITFMEKLDTKKDISLYVECCLCIGDKIVEINSLVRFLPFISDLDVENFLLITARCRTENNILWNTAIKRLKSPNFIVVINYIVEQLAIRFERSQILAAQNIRLVVQNLLDEKNYRSDVCSHFLRGFLEKFKDTTYSVELIVPVWLAVSLENLVADDIDDLSACVCKNLITSFRKNDLNFDYNADVSSTTNAVRWMLETVSRNSSKRWVNEVIAGWSELLVSPLQSILLKAERTTTMHCCRIASYLYLYLAKQIYKPPSECNFNRSPFVRLSKLLLQNVLLVHDFPPAFIREVIPNYMQGLLSLPIHSVPYLLRVLSYILEKYLDDIVLKEAFTDMLKKKPHLISALYASSTVGTNLFSFVSHIK